MGAEEMGAEEMGAEEEEEDGMVWYGISRCW